MDEQSFNKALATAQMLMNDPGFNALVESKAARHSGSKRGGGSRGKSSVEFSDFEAMAGLGATSNTTAPIITENIVQQIKQKQSNVASEIQESFKKMPSLSGGSMGMYTPAAVQQDLLREQQMYQQPTYTPQYQQPTIQQQGIDYTIIKGIVNECIKENMKQQLNEGVVSGLKIGPGNKIQFVDSKGNLYEGVLTLKKKAQK